MNKHHTPQNPDIATVRDNLVRTLADEINMNAVRTKMMQDIKAELEAIDVTAADAGVLRSIANQIYKLP